MEKGYSNIDCEKLAVKVYEYIFGVHKQTTNLAIYGDLGRTSFIIDIACALIKYLRRLEEINSESLLGKDFNSSKEIHTSVKESWCTSVLFIMQQLNIDAIMNLLGIESKLIKMGETIIPKCSYKRRKLRTYNMFKHFLNKDKF